MIRAFWGVMAVVVLCSPGTVYGQSAGDVLSPVAEMVTHGTLSEEPSFDLKEAPDFEFGTASGQPAEEFFRVRGAQPVGGDRLAVLDAGSREVRFFSLVDGRHLRSVGGLGDGPGEFRTPTAMFSLPPDSVVVWDSGLGRATIIGADGGIRVITVHDLASPELVAVLPGGLMLIDHRVGEADGSVQRIIGHEFLYSWTGERVDSLGAHPWRRMEVMAFGGGAVEGRPTLFDQETMWAVSAMGVWVATGQLYELELRGFDGHLIRRVQWSGASLRVTDRDREAYILSEVAGVTDPDEADFRRWDLGGRAMPAYFPAISGLAADLLGNAWVRLFERPGAPSPSEWLVFNPTGEFLGRLRTPRSARVVAFVGSSLVMIETDDLGVEYVRLYSVPNPLG